MHTMTGLTYLNERQLLEKLNMSASTFKRFLNSLEKAEQDSFPRITIGKTIRYPEQLVDEYLLQKGGLKGGLALEEMSET